MAAGAATVAAVGNTTVSDAAVSDAAVSDAALGDATVGDASVGDATVGVAGAVANAAADAPEPLELLAAGRFFEDGRWTCHRGACQSQ